MRVLLTPQLSWINAYVHPLVAFEGFLNFSEQLDALKENFLKIIQLYKRNDIFLLCSLPSGRAFARIPVGGIVRYEL